MDWAFKGLLWTPHSDQVAGRFIAQGCSEFDLCLWENEKSEGLPLGDPDPEGKLPDRTRKINYFNFLEFQIGSDKKLEVGGRILSGKIPGILII